MLYRCISRAIKGPYRQKRASDHRGTPRNFPRIQITGRSWVTPYQLWASNPNLWTSLTMTSLQHSWGDVIHTHTQHTVVHKMLTVVHYSLVCTTHSGTEQLQQCTTYTMVHDAGLAEGKVAYPLIYLSTWCLFICSGSTHTGKQLRLSKCWWILVCVSLHHCGSMIMFQNVVPIYIGQRFDL